MRLLSLAIVGALASPARAEPSEGTARLLSVGGTVLPIVGIAAVPSLPKEARAPVIGTMLVALMVGPSAGHFYAGDYFSTGLQIRLGGAAAMALGGLIVFGGKDGTRSERVPYNVAGGLVGAAGVIAVGVGAVHDVLNADDAARAARTDRTRMFSIGGRF